MAQTNPDSVFVKHIIRTYPLNYFAAGEINLGYEHVINNKESYEIILAWNFRDWVVIPSYITGASNSTAQFLPSSFLDEGGLPVLIPSLGGSFRFNYRHYFTKNKPMPLGAYYSPQFMFKHTVFNDLYRCYEGYCDSLKITKNAVTLKFLIGYQSRIFKNFSIDYYFGVGFRYQNEKAIRYYCKRWKENPDEFTEDTEKVTKTLNFYTPTIHLGLSIGYFF